MTRILVWEYKRGDLGEGKSPGAVHGQSPDGVYGDALRSQRKQSKIRLKTENAQ